jgi:acyl carrier protein
VETGVVVLRAGADGAEPVLVAYAVPKQAGYAVSHSDRATPEKLAAWLGAQLPEHMVPSAVVLLDALPLTANGKVDRAALPDVDGGSAGEASYVEPRTPTEQTIARIWGDVLKKERVGVTDSFLDLGGHSLLAIRVLGRISKELGVRLALRALFETPTVERIAAIVDAERAQREQAMREAALSAVAELSDAEVTELLAERPVGEQQR